MRGPIKSPHRSRVSHADAAATARSRPGTWVRAATYASRMSADSAARRIPGAERMPNYEPAGAFEAYAITTVEGPSLWVRSTEGGPYPPIPDRMAVRIPVSGPELGEVGVLTVYVAPYCQTCGGPRGWDRIQPVEMRFGQDVVLVDRWANPCGHDDVYADVLVEARRTPPSVAPADARGRGHHPGDPARAGAFRDAVELILGAAATTRGMHAKQAAALLRTHGHTEAAGLVEAKLRAEHGHLSAKQAAHFLTVEGAGRRSTRTTRRETT